MNGEIGWVYAEFQVDANGQVVEVVPILYTHHEFARSGQRAISDWKFEPVIEHCDRDRWTYTQTLEYNLAR